MILIFSRQIAADESILQLAIRPALSDLDRFNRNPTRRNATMLVKIPTLYDVLKYENSRVDDDQSTYSETLRGVCIFLHERGIRVLKQITVHTTETHHMDIQEGKRDWEKVCPIR